MNTIVNRPGVTLLIAGVVAFLARWIVRWIPLVGRPLSFVLLAFCFFAIVGGVWMLVVGRGSSD